MNIMEEITRILISICIGLTLTNIGIKIFNKLIDLYIKCIVEVRNGKEK